MGWTTNILLISFIYSYVYCAFILQRACKRYTNTFGKYHCDFMPKEKGHLTWRSKQKNIWHWLHLESKKSVAISAIQKKIIPHPRNSWSVLDANLQGLDLYFTAALNVKNLIGSLGCIKWNVRKDRWLSRASQFFMSPFVWHLPSNHKGRSQNINTFYFLRYCINIWIRKNEQMNQYSRHFTRTGV